MSGAWFWFDMVLFLVLFSCQKRTRVGRKKTNIYLFNVCFKDTHQIVFLHKIMLGAWFWFDMVLFLVLFPCQKRTRVGRKKKIYIYICIYDKWNYHLDKATPAPFLYCYYYYICLFGWLRSIEEVSRSDTSD